MKIRIKKFLIILFIFSMCLSLFSCKKKKNTSFSEDKTIRISYDLAAYGDEWIKQAITLFNNLYEEKGWHAVLDRDDPNSSEISTNEIRSYTDNPYDLYIDISMNNLNDVLDSSYSVLKSKNQYLLESLESLYDMHPIDLKGNEEPETIRQNTHPTILSAMGYYGNNNPKIYGQLFGYQWASGYAGMIINKAAFEKYGYEVPRTTNEMKKLCDQVLKDNNTADTGNKVYPITWAGANASGFMSYCLEAWLGQWMGPQGFEDFYALKPANGDTKNNGYEVYDNIGIKYAFETNKKLFNLNYSCNGTLTTIDHVTSVQILADGEALFGITGDYAYNECKKCGYDFDELEVMSLMNMPLLSELADKFNLPGNDADEKDACLSLIAKYVDEGKTDNEIVNLVSGVTVEQAAQVRQARGIYFEHATTHYCYIPSYADAKEGAKLFLRFIASKDFAENVFGPYAGGVTSNRNANVTCTEMCRALTRITKSSYAYPVAYEEHLSKIRMSGAISFVFEPATGWPDLMKSIATGAIDPDTFYNQVKNGMKSNWGSIISVSGVYDD